MSAVKKTAKKTEKVVKVAKAAKVGKVVKAAKVSKVSKVQKSAPDSQQETAPTTTPGGRYCRNPLPEDAVGDRLLVELQAEKIMEKLHLKEKWEGPNGWDFADLCAVVACALGENFIQPGEKELAANAISKRKPRLIANISKKASPALVTDDSTESVLPETFQGVLILGLGTPKFPIKLTEENYSDTVKLQMALAELMEVQESRVNLRSFEEAKRQVRQRYNEHQVKQAEREKRRVTSAPNKKAKVSGRSQTSLLTEAFGKLAREGKLMSSDSSGPTNVATKAFLQAGLPLPGPLKVARKRH
jgi:hypothetical protein